MTFDPMQNMNQNHLVSAVIAMHLKHFDAQFPSLGHFDAQFPSLGHFDALFPSLGHFDAQCQNLTPYVKI